jgi:hypothetical protein
MKTNDGVGRYTRVIPEAPCAGAGGVVTVTPAYPRRSSGAKQPGAERNSVCTFMSGGAHQEDIADIERGTCDQQYPPRSTHGGISLK